MPEFVPKSASELTQDVVDVVTANTTQVNDFTPGSKIRTLIEGFAHVVSTLYQSTFQRIKQAIEEAIYDAFNFPADPGKRATTTVTFSRSAAALQDYIIPAGTLVATDTSDGSVEVQYSTDTTVILSAGTTTVSVNVTAVDIGKNANVQAGKISVLKTKPVGVESVTNPASVYDGKNAETADQRQKRFRDYIAAFGQGTSDALINAAKSVAGVTDVEVIENPELTVFVSSGVGTGFNDISNEANKPYGDGVTVAPTTVGDALYIGAIDKFTLIWFQFLQVGAGGAGVWEYWNGVTAAWDTLSVNDGTGNMTQSASITFAAPDTWYASKVNSVFQFWVRYRLTTVFTTPPTIYHLIASPPPGWVDLYVQDTNAQASDSMKQSVAAILPQYRGHGVTINVKGPTIRAVDIEAHITIADGYDRNTVKAQLENDITSYLNSFKFKDDLYLNKLVTEIIRLGRGAVLNATVAIPTTDIFASGGELIRPGTSVTVIVDN